MPGLNADSPGGVLRRGWSAEVGDYAIAGGWSLRGEALMVGDAAGGVYAFDGKSGATAWARRGFMMAACSRRRSTRTEPRSPPPARTGES